MLPCEMQYCHEQMQANHL